MIELYTWSTPNGRKVSIMLEECGLPYNVHKINIGTNTEQFAPDYLKINPNGKIPSIVDPDGPDGKPIAMMESGAILVYLSGKTGKFLPRSARGKCEALQWLMFQMGGIGPMFGQVGFFHKFAGKDYEDKRPRDRYVNEAKRLLAVLDGHLKGKSWMLGEDFSIADIAIFPWVRNLVGFYGACDLVGFSGFQEVQRVLQAFVQRPAVIRGLEIPKKEG
jgi:GSH-dependent disulfide-bond oxidoreductase